MMKEDQTDDDEEKSLITTTTTLSSLGNEINGSSSSSMKKNLIKRQELSPKKQQEQNGQQQQHEKQSVAAAGVVREGRFVPKIVFIGIVCLGAIFATGSVLNSIMKEMDRQESVENKHKSKVANMAASVVATTTTKPNDDDNDDGAAKRSHTMTNETKSTTKSTTKSKSTSLTKSTKSLSKSNNSNSSHIMSLDKLLDGEKIIGDVSSLLDFAIMDFPKCGTTFLMSYLGKSDEAYINQGEICSMDRNRPFRIVQQYYNLPRLTPDGRNKLQIGLKCPQELETEFAMENFAKYFPQTKYIITTRHPISYFQSYYNFRAYHGYPIQMPSTSQLIGPCQPGYAYVPLCNRHCEMKNENVCTDRANFHHALSRMGKTPMNTTKERNLLRHNMKIVPLQGKVFLMDMEQIKIENPSSKNFARDLRDFLELKHDLPALKPFSGRQDKYPNKEAAKHLINICDDEHDNVRKILMANGAEAAEWIRDYFLKSPDVIVSSKELFIEVIERWSHDPCEDKKNKSRQLSSLDDDDPFFF